MLQHWIWYAMRSGMNDRDKLALLEHFHDPEDIYNASAADYFRAGANKNAAQSLQDKSLLEAEQVIAQCEELGIGVVTFGDAQYPSRLKYIADPPMVLYFKGKLPDFDSTAVIGVVGTRKASLYGLNIARRMGYQISRCGGIMVSGMAAGIDGAATKGALTAGGNAVGILGCGVDVVYPLSNKMLFGEMEHFGCLISEYLPGTPPYKWNFPRRNRLISGLSNGVLVAEAPLKSGALITARQALEQGRDVFVVPGNIDVASCAGSNGLLREGAIAVSHGWDILSEYTHLYGAALRQCADEPQVPKVAQKPLLPAVNVEKKPKEKKISIDNGENVAYSDKNDKLSKLNPQEQKMLEGLRDGPRFVDDVIAGSGMSPGLAKAKLTMLEIRGVIATLPGGRIALK
jgi:DNA processing protein